MTDLMQLIKYATSAPWFTEVVVRSWIFRQTDSCKRPIEEIVGAQNFSFASEFPQNGLRLVVNVTFLEENIPARKNFRNLTSFATTSLQRSVQQSDCTSLQWLRLKLRFSKYLCIARMYVPPFLRYLVKCLCCYNWWKLSLSAAVHRGWTAQLDCKVLFAVCFILHKFYRIFIFRQVAFVWILTAQTSQVEMWIEHNWWVNVCWDFDTRLLCCKHSFIISNWIIMWSF